MCLFVCLWVCYHDNSKLRASILTKLGLYVKVVTISSWLNVGRTAPPGRGLRRGEIFWHRLTTASAQCLRLSERFFSFNRAFVLSPALHNIFHSPMARYSLFVLKVPLNTNKPNQIFASVVCFLECYPFGLLH